MTTHNCSKNARALCSPMPSLVAVSRDVRMSFSFSFCKYFTVSPSPSGLLLCYARSASRGAWVHPLHFHRGKERIYRRTKITTIRTVYRGIPPAIRSIVNVRICTYAVLLTRGWSLVKGIRTSNHHKHGLKPGFQHFRSCLRI